jgi:hypothetical protein
MALALIHIISKLSFCYCNSDDISHTINPIKYPVISKFISNNLYYFEQILRPLTFVFKFLKYMYILKEENSSP